MCSYAQLGTSTRLSLSERRQPDDTGTREQQVVEPRFLLCTLHTTVFRPFSFQFLIHSRKLGWNLNATNKEP